MELKLCSGWLLQTLSARTWAHLTQQSPEAGQPSLNIDNARRAKVRYVFQQKLLYFLLKNKETNKQKQY